MAARSSSASTFLSLGANLPAITSSTIMGWFFRVGAGTGTGTDSLFAIGDASNVANVFCNVSTGKYSLFDGNLDHDSTIAIANTTWTHFAMTCSGAGANQLIMYINGTQAATGTLTGVTAATIWFMGDGTGFAEWYNGRVCGAHIFNRALSASEILLASKSIFFGGSMANVVGAYPILSGGSRTADVSGLGHNLIDNGPTSDEADAGTIPISIPYFPVEPARVHTIVRI
jgi:hypothetical protein